MALAEFALVEYVMGSQFDINCNDGELMVTDHFAMGIYQPHLDHKLSHITPFALVFEHEDWDTLFWTI